MKTILVPLDAPNLVERLKADLIAMYKPMNTQELFAIERVALAQQAMRRCSMMEAGLFAMNFDDGEPDSSEDASEPNLFTFGHPQQLKAWQTFLRYQAQTERMYRRALADLDRIIALRDEQPEAEELPVAVAEIRAFAAAGDVSQTLLSAAPRFVSAHSAPEAHPK